MLITCLCLMLISVLPACSCKTSDSEKQSGNETVKVKEIRSLNSNDGSRSEASPPRTIYETKEKLMFYTTQGIYLYDKDKKKLVSGFTVIDKNTPVADPEYDDHSGKVRINAQGDITFAVDISKDKKEVYIFAYDGPANKAVYYICNLANKKVTKINGVYKKTVKDEKGIDKLMDKQGRGWYNEPEYGNADIKHYRYKSPQSGKVYAPFKAK